MRFVLQKLGMFRMFDFSRKQESSVDHAAIKAPALPSLSSSFRLFNLGNILTPKS